MFTWMYKGDLCVCVCRTPSNLSFLHQQKSGYKCNPICCQQTWRNNLKKKFHVTVKYRDYFIDLWECHLKILTFDICSAASEVFKAFSQYLKARINFVNPPEHVVLPCHVICNSSWYLHSFTWKSEGSWSSAGLSVGILPRFLSSDELQETICVAVWWPFQESKPSSKSVSELVSMSSGTLEGTLKSAWNPACPSMPGRLILYQACPDK